MTGRPPNQSGATSRLLHYLRRLIGRPAPSADVPRAASERPAATPLSVGLTSLSTAQYVHDLRNLLHVISVCAECMAAHTPAARTEWGYAELLQATELASMLTRKLLLASRPTLTIRGVVDLNDVIAAEVDTLSRLAGDRIRVQCRLSAEAAPIRAEVSELHRIILNLVLNARDAMPAGGLLGIDTAVVPAQGPEESQDAPYLRPYVRLRVSDTGSGMTSDVKARIFEPFFTTKDAGTGLGLSSVKFTLEQLEGTIAVESQPRAGTRVTIHLPITTHVST
jgi:two-component system, cell cycle sensor histidine kinase and response regulator CckA